MGETNTLPRFTDEGRESYMLIHKKPVGPGTAERLFSLYEQYTRHSEYRMQYIAGWTALEAAMVGTHLSPETRVQIVNAAKDSWEYALQLQGEYAAHMAWKSGNLPANANGYRIANVLATIGVFRELPFGQPSLESIEKMHHTMVDIAIANAEDFQTAVSYKNHGRMSEHKGLLVEQLTMCAVNRLYSRKFLAIPSFARSDSSIHYPDQTHDVQFLQLEWGSLRDVIPNEVKSRRSGKAFERYVKSALVFGEDLTQGGHFSLPAQVARFKAEIDDTIEPYDEFMLQDITDSVLHSIRHFKRPELSGVHCRNKNKCQFDTGTTPNQSVV